MSASQRKHGGDRSGPEAAPLPRCGNDNDANSHLRHHARHVALTGPAAFICLVNAGIALRKEGGTVFWVGGSFSRWMLWTVIFLALEPTLIWFQFLGFPVFFPPGAAIGNAVACRHPAGHHDVCQRFCCGADRTGCGRLLRHPGRS